MRDEIATEMIFQQLKYAENEYIKPTIEFHLIRPEIQHSNDISQNGALDNVLPVIFQIIKFRAIWPFI